ncbi:WD40 repeat-like protein [Massarina eburnea CBS 473.64]|uniref:Probable cytosolic iron-sulfur protein assembly protein 1 n=1 Tax=Massarina eburnea CBS 473.64 TaxID=1395130 RepID=A0A6A6RLH3_9PLEO|nr:WD40 repeat-like protein [Massarina eburnea CBS 473.64]
MTSPTLALSHVLRPLATLSPPSNSRTWQTAPHPSQPIVATACSDRTVRVYSLTSFTLLHSITGGHKRSVRSVGWKPGVRGQSVLATGSFDASAGIWRRREDDESEPKDFTNRNTGDSDEEEEDDDYQFACILDGHESEIKSLAWSPSGQYLATCSRDKSVWIWEELEDDNFETVAVLTEHDGDVKCVNWHPEEDLLVSSSYDDSVRLYREDSDDWVQVAAIDGHKMTVWWAAFEGSGMAKVDFRKQRDGLGEKQTQYIELLERSGPRLATCSDDCTVRLWRRRPRERHDGGTGMPSIIRSAAIDEDWLPEATLPQQHTRAVYSLSWSQKTGLIVSAGSDGKIIIYKERWKAPDAPSTSNGASNGASADDQNKDWMGEWALSEWVVVAELWEAHGVFEINHVTWAARRDKGVRWEGEEVVLSTGDDGEVRVWTLDELDVQEGEGSDADKMVDA